MNFSLTDFPAGTFFDRRLAASDEVVAMNGGDIYRRQRTRGGASRRGRMIQGYLGGSRVPGPEDQCHLSPQGGPEPERDRQLNEINTIVLHQGSGSRRLGTGSAHCAPASDDELIDRVAAHFVVLLDGRIFYTHDVRYRINNVGSFGAGTGIDIEFLGEFYARDRDRSERDVVSLQMVQSGRRLVAALRRRIPNIFFIHPHGQIQTNGQGKFDSCPGPDIWVPIGFWAVREHRPGFICVPPRPGWPNHGISVKQQGLPAHYVDHPEEKLQEARSSGLAWYGDDSSLRPPGATR